jgi:putative protease
LCLIKYLKELKDAGVTSFKIEGRAKSVYYQATVVGIYRRALNLLNKKIPAVKLKKELNYLYSELETKLVHRGYTTGFLLGAKAEQNITASHNQSNWKFCGQVLNPKIDLRPTLVKKLKLNNPVIFQVHNTVRAKEEIELIRPDYDIIKIRPQKLWDAKTGREIKEAHGGGGGQIAILELPESVGLTPILTVIRRKIKS